MLLRSRHRRRERLAAVVRSVDSDPYVRGWEREEGIRAFTVREARLD
ncbi:MAG: hypothetical protein L0G69_07200 [Brevibacterium sp.]|nr:hypothetical protein [Brevibacterium sp.]